MLSFVIITILQPFMIGWTSRVADAGSEGLWNMRLSSSDGKQLRFLTEDQNVNGYPAWSKDGNFIYFHRMEYGPNTSFGIYRIQPDGQGMRVICGGEAWNNEYPST